MVKKYDVVLAQLGKGKGATKQGLRPCVILQGNPANKTRLQTVTIAPLTKQLHTFPSMQMIHASKENGLAVDSCLDLSQIRTVDRNILQGVLGHLEERHYQEISEKIMSFLDLRNEYL